MAAPLLRSGTKVRVSCHRLRSEGTPISTQRLLLALLATAALSAACADAPSGVEAALPDELGGLRAAATVELDAERVAADALASLLADAGFEGATERTYTGPSAGIRRIAVRVLRFGTPDGAERYLRWTRAHASEIIGELAGTVQSEAGLVFIHEPGGCCAKELPLAMGAWRSGREVIRVVVAGSAAEGPAGAELLARLHSRIGRTG